MEKGHQMMAGNPLPAAVRDRGSLMALGQVRGLAPHPLTAVCVVKHVGGTDSIWIDLGYPLADYSALWRAVHPTTQMPVGCRVAPLINRSTAERLGVKLVRLVLVGVGPIADGTGKGYVLTSVSHSATDPRD
jgi:hypothetical protein